jgi:nucleotide-binding universal stress UspA family protein
MYRKIVVPLDKSQVAEAVLPQLQALETLPEAELILLHVIRPVRAGVTVGDRVVSPLELEESERGNAQAYLKTVADRLRGGRFRVRTLVKVQADVAEAIVGCAKEEQVDLIAMYTHDRSGLSRLLSRSVAEKVRRTASTEVRVFAARELVAA